MAASAPALTASIMMTDATPMITPSVVRKERTRLSLSPSQATRSVSLSVITPSPFQAMAHAVAAV